MLSVIHHPWLLLRGWLSVAGLPRNFLSDGMRDSADPYIH